MNIRPTSRREMTPPFSDINVTPLVDVMLVLLVIFMVTAPLLTVGVPVDLPKTSAAQMSDQVEPLTISIDKTGAVYLQETPLELAALIERLRAITGQNPDMKIYIRGDQGLQYGRIMEVMGAVAAAGFHKVSLLAEMPAGKKKPVTSPAKSQQPPVIGRSKPVASAGTATPVSKPQHVLKEPTKR